MAAFFSEQTPIFEPKRDLRVIGIGAGASGLLLAYKIQRHFDNFSLTIYEKNTEPSGTWFENRYPGCACDVPAHCYTWSFEPKTDWSSTYASSTEIHKYFNDFKTKYGLDRYIKLQHAVSSAVWNATTAMWEVEIKNLATGETIKDSCHVLVNAGGILNAWRYPPIPGIKDYKGELVHSAAWDPRLSLEGKHVGLIGNGSSGIQILPAIKNQVSHLTTFIREPTWVSPPIGQEYKVYTRDDHVKFATEPESHLKVRQEIEGTMNSMFRLFWADSDIQNMSKTHMLDSMRSKLQNADLEEKLIPKWSVGCRRITPGRDYLESLSDPKVDVVFGEIDSITEKGCVVEGKEYPVDVLICATGFDTTFKPRFPLHGDKGQLLSEEWKDEPQSYFGIAASGYPNYFMTLGPNCPVGNGPLLIAIEYEIDYIVKTMAKYQKENYRTFDVKADAVKDFVAWKDKYMQGTIWTEQCRSWYKAGSIYGNVAALWPGSTLHYLEAMAEPRWEDWTWEHDKSQNRFEYLGSGQSSAETRAGGDLAYYIRNADDSPLDMVLKASAFKSPNDVPKSGLRAETVSIGQGPAAAAKTE